MIEENCQQLIENDQNQMKIIQIVQGFDGINKSDLKSQSQIPSKILSGWKNINKSKISIKDMSQGGNGGKVFLIECQNAIPDKIILHSIYTNNLQNERIQSIQNILSQNQLCPPRIIQGEDWYIEPYYGKSQNIGKDIESVKQLGNILTQLHKIPINWFEQYRNQCVNKFSFLKDLDQGHPIWKLSCRSLKDFKEKKYQKIAELNFLKPLSEPGKRIVTCHGDIHKDNILFNENKLYLIDFDWTYVGYAASDIAFLIDRNIPKKMLDLKIFFVKNYLDNMGDSSTSENINMFLYDIECQKFKDPQLSDIIQNDVMYTMKYDNYDMDLCKLYIDFEIQSRGDYKLQQLIIQQGFHQAIQNQIGQSIYSVCSKLQSIILQQNIQIEDEQKMLQKALQKGIIRLYLDHNLNDIYEAQLFAESKAGGLATRKELKYSGVNIGNNIDFWNPVIRDDGLLDLCQLGTHSSKHKKRYISHHDRFFPVNQKFLVNQMQYPKVFMYVKSKEQQLQDQQNKLKKNESIFKKFINILKNKKK